MAKERKPAASRKTIGGGSATGSKQSLTNVTHVKGVNFYRDAKQVRKLAIQKSGKPTRNADGKIIKAGMGLIYIIIRALNCIFNPFKGAFQSRLPSGTQARVEPNRRWFENTRVVNQTQLAGFREAIASKMNDPYSFVLRTKQLPLGLVTDEPKQQRMHLLEVCYRFIALLNPQV